MDGKQGRILFSITFCLILVVTCTPDPSDGRRLEQHLNNDDSKETTVRSTTPSRIKTCRGYCSPEYGDISDFECGGHRDPYCCGNRTSRYCCNNSSQDISDLYPSSRRCASYLSGWQALFGILALILFVLLLSLCCCNFLSQCQCSCPCRKNRERDRQRQRRRRRTARVSSVRTISGGVEEVPDDPNQRLPSPPVRFTFTPPDYETVCKDLPKYEDVIAGNLETETFSGNPVGVTIIGNPGVVNEGFSGNVLESTTRHPTSGRGARGSRGTTGIELADRRLPTPPPPYDNSVRDRACSI